MTEIGSQGFVELALQLGIAVLLFGALIIFSAVTRHWIKTEQLHWTEEFKLREQKDAGDKLMLTSLIEKNFSILTDVMRDSREQIHAITQLVERIKQMQIHYDQAFRDLFIKHDDHTKNPCFEHFRSLLEHQNHKE
ncbi:MAG: hypothetical protein HKK66_03290 [Chlorobiaceae bacterium]|nr:hypothetical protein [Chlorobiaceae bacterium]